MYRAPRHCASAAAVAATVSVRWYTPIYQSDAASDQLAPLRHADELKTLWRRALPVPTLGRAVQLWLRYGNDPVVHTSVPPLMPDGSRTTSAAFPSASPFAYVEDFAGTNLVETDTQRIRESVELWSTHFEKKFLMRLRQSRRTSAGHIGVISAPATMADEADQPSTKWSQDTHFREVAFLSERHLKEKVSSPLQLEEALVSKASPEQFLAFFNAYQQETASRVPLPVSAVWVYEGEAQKAWLERYHPAAKAAFQFFKTVLAADVKRSQSPETVTKAVAAALKKYHGIVATRIARQREAGICPDWSTPEDMHAEQKLTWTQNACEKQQRSILEGDADPEDILDTSEEWKTEHDAIEKLLGETVAGCSFTLKDFWMHTIRREELETSYLLESDHLRDVAAAAQRALFHEVKGDFGVVFAGIEDAVARGYLDLRAGVFAPRFNPVYAKLNYAKFGASAIVQHTNTASRQLLYHYASSPEEVTAAATLYYATKPMSSKLNYASPYTLRKSLLALCAAYGVDITHAAQKPFLLSAANLAKAEGIIGRVVRAEAAPLGVVRRALQQKQRQESQRLLSPVSKVSVCEPPSVLLPTGAEEAAITAHAVADAPPAKTWPLGSVKTVRYHWPSPQLDKLKFFLQANSSLTTGNNLTAEKMVELEEIQRSGRLEISLWRKRTAAEVESEKAAQMKEQKEVADLIKQSPELAEVKQYANNLFSRLSRGTGNSESAAAAAAESGEWVFAVMLDDCARLTEEEAVSVFLPYVDAQGQALPQGEYRVRVRAYSSSNTIGGGSSSSSSHIRGDDAASDIPVAHPAMCTEAYSEAFPVFDAVPQLVEQFFHKAGNASGASIHTFAGKDLVPFCEFMRAAGLDVPLRFEFEVGQGLDVKGNIPLARFVQLLKGNDFHKSQCERGLTATQREVEPDCKAHWELYHAGASAEEWACVRRDVLRAALSGERAWWLPDPLLSVGDTVTSPVSDSGVAAASVSSTARYAAELCSVLSAGGSSLEDEAVPAAPGTVDRRLRADCVVDGTGAITSLDFAGPTAEVSVEQALEVALAATRRAQDRHNTLSMFKLAPFEKAAQVMGFCGVHGQEFGGKYARTYCYALDKAKQELAETLVSGRVVLGANDDSDKARLSDQEKRVDRFASATHPELRKKQFAARQTESGQGVEDPTPDQTSTWGR